METKASKIRWAVDMEGTWLQILVEDGQEARFYAEANQDKPQRLRLTRWTEKRSLNANAYAWKLLGELSAKLHLPAAEIYRDLIPDVGGNAVTATIAYEALATMRESWESNGIGWVCQLIGMSAPGKVDVMLYYGSSTYDSAQMGRLIDLIIEECKQNDVEYLPPEKLAAMLGEWDEQKKSDKGNSH